MKAKKLFLIPLAALALSGALVLGACGHDPFVNPGDKLGGGGTGEVAEEVNDSTSSADKTTVKGESDLSGLAQDTAGENVKTIAPTLETVEISATGSYYFKGSYSKIMITKKDIDAHFIFDGATFVNESGNVIECDKKPNSVLITLKEGTTNSVTNGGDDVNAIHVKGMLLINGKGTLNVTSNSKSALKASKAIKIVDATLNVTAQNHGVTGASVAMQNCSLNVVSAGKDGINAEGDGMTAFSASDGFVSLQNVDYTCNVQGDGIQAATIVYVGGGIYNITTNGTFVPKTQMSEYGMAADDFKFIKSGSDYKRIASDEAGRYGASSLYGLAQGCKGIKVGEIEYEDDGGNTVTVTEGDYLIVLESGTFTIDSTDDALHTNSGNLLIEGGTYTLSTYDDAITSDNLTKITGGDITITTSYEGIEGAYVEISGGKIDLTATDDGINAASDDRAITEHIIISGGDITVNSSGDGIDSNGSILISGGSVLVYGPTSGRDAGLDADKGIVITGGKVFATSTLGMVETPSTNSTQYVVSYAHQSAITTGSVVSLRDSEGNTLFSVDIVKQCQSIIFSTPDLNKGSSYALYGGSTKLTDFTVSSIITTIGSSGSSFPGGRPGGPGGPGGRW